MIGKIYTIVTIDDIVWPLTLIDTETIGAPIGLILLDISSSYTSSAGRISDIPLYGPTSRSEFAIFAAAHIFTSGMLCILYSVSSKSVLEVLFRPNCDGMLIPHDSNAWF